MGSRTGGLSGRLLDRLAQRRWRRLAQRADAMPVPALRRLRNVARTTACHLQAFLHVAEGRLGGPLHGRDGIARTHDTDWAWRPEAWRGPLPGPGLVAVASGAGLGAEVSLHHDCPAREFVLRQVRNTRATDLAPHGIALDVFRFEGSYLSLAVALPAEGCRDLGPRHILRVEMQIEMERPLEVLARLSLRQGPNVDQMIHEFDMTGQAAVVDFDLGYGEAPQGPVEAGWIDLIFEAPAMNRLVIRDIAVTRRLRASL